MREFTRHTKRSIGRLLVVDDDLVQRTVIGKIGARLGYDTIAASSLEVAARLLQQERFDVMTLDLSLGEHDGIELLRIAANRALTAMSVVVISGCDERIVNSTRRVAEALGLSFTASLSKPLDLDQLRDALLLPAQSHAFAKEPKLGSVIPRERILQAFAEREFSDRLRHRPGLPVCSVDGRPANLALGFASNPAAGQGASGGLARRWGDP